MLKETETMTTEKKLSNMHHGKVYLKAFRENIYTYFNFAGMSKKGKFNLRKVIKKSV